MTKTITKTIILDTYFWGAGNSSKIEIINTSILLDFFCNPEQPSIVLPIYLQAGINKRSHITANYINIFSLNIEDETKFILNKKRKGLLEFLIGAYRFRNDRFIDFMVNLDDLPLKSKIVAIRSADRRILEHTKDPIIEKLAVDYLSMVFQSSGSNIKVKSVGE